MGRRQFRIRDTRFSVIDRRDNTHALYRANIDGNASWWFLGIFPNEKTMRSAARKNANHVPIRPRRESVKEDAFDRHGAGTRFSGALERAQIRSF